MAHRKNTSVSRRRAVTTDPILNNMETVFAQLNQDLKTGDPLAVAAEYGLTDPDNWVDFVVRVAEKAEQMTQPDIDAAIAYLDPSPAM